MIILRMMPVKLLFCLERLIILEEEGERQEQF